MRKLSLLLLSILLIPVLFLTSCSDDAGGATPSVTATLATSPAASATAVPETTATVATDGSSAQNVSTDGAIKGSVKVDFTGAPRELEAIDMPFSVPEGSTAWQAVTEALGEDNVSSQDFGGDLGVFITGFKGVAAEGNHFWEFKLNGDSAEVGAGKYEVKQGDVLEFVYSSF